MKLIGTPEEILQLKMNCKLCDCSECGLQDYCDKTLFKPLYDNDYEKVLDYINYVETGEVKKSYVDKNGITHKIKVPLDELKIEPILITDKKE